MTDILDINADFVVELNAEVESDQKSVSSLSDKVATLKKKVFNRKGRGFKFSDERNDKNIVGVLKNALFDNNPLMSANGWILFVTSLHEEATEEDLNEKFSPFGHIFNVNINLDRRTGFLKGYALIEFEDFQEADNARQALNGSEILGQIVQVNWCFTMGIKRSKRTKHSKKTMELQYLKENSI